MKKRIGNQRYTEEELLLLPKSAITLKLEDSLRLTSHKGKWLHHYQYRKKNAGWVRFRTDLQAIPNGSVYIGGCIIS